MVHARGLTSPVLFPTKSSLQPGGPSSCTLLGWFRLPPIDQYSSLLPPVGVWAVSQSQCGGVFLSEPLDIVAMVGRCPAIKLMSREPIRYRRTFQLKAMQPQVVWDISRRFHRLSPCIGQVAHVLRTLPPVAVRVLLLHAAPRLACVKPAASVHPEPGSNSSLYIFYISSSIRHL